MGIKNKFKRKVFFTELIIFINKISEHKNNKVTRNEIMNHFKNTTNNNFMSYDVIDKYRAWLTKAGYLEKTFISGSYEIKTKIPENLSSSKLEKIAYPQRFNK